MVEGGGGGGQVGQKQITDSPGQDDGGGGRGGIRGEMFKITEHVWASFMDGPCGI